MRVAVFGHGVPWGIFAPFGVPVEDVTLGAARPVPQIAAYLEPFMDPFARAVLDGLAGGAFNGVDLLVFLRESPGALPAFHYACDFARRGLLPADAPALHLLNLVPSDTPAAHRFNLTEIDRLADVLCGAGGGGALSLRDATIAATRAWGRSGWAATGLVGRAAWQHCVARGLSAAWPTGAGSAGRRCGTRGSRPILSRA